MVVGLVSGVGLSLVGVHGSFTLGPVGEVRRDGPVESLVASPTGGAVVTDAGGAEETFEFLGASEGALRAISRTIVSCT